MEKGALTSQKGTLSHKFCFTGLLCSAGLVMFTTQGICSEPREISFSVEENPMTYDEVMAAVAETTGWEAEESFSIRLTNKNPKGAAYVVYRAEYPDAFNAESMFTATGAEGDSVVIYPKKLTIESTDVGVLFARTDETAPGFGNLITDCDVHIKAPIVIKEEEGVSGTFRFTARDPDYLRTEEQAWTPTVNLVGDYRFSEGRLEFDSVNATVVGQGTIGTLALNETVEGHGTTLHITDAPSSAKRTFLRVEELELSSGEVKISGTGFGTILQTSNLSALTAASGGTVEVKDGGALVLGEVPTGGNDISEAGEEVIRLLGDVEVARGSLRPTLVTSTAMPRVFLEEDSTLTIKVGSIESDATAESAASILLGSDARWVLLCGEESSSRTRAMGSTFTIQARDGAELVINGWSGEEFDLNLTWNPENVTFINSTLGRAKAVLTDGGIRVTRQLMHELPSLKSRNTVKTSEEALYAGVSNSLGEKFIQDAINDEKVGLAEFAPFVDSSVFLPFASGAFVLSERAFDATHSYAMSRPIVRTTERTHWWVSVSREKYRIPVSMLRGTVTTASLGVDRTLNTNWSGFFSVSGTKIDSKTSGISSTISGDTAVATASLALERKLFTDSALRFGLTAGRAEVEAKRFGVGYRIKTKPNVTFAGIGARFESRFGDANRFVMPMFGVNGYYAKIKDGDVENTNLNNGHHGTGFKTTAKSRTWGDLTAGFTAKASWEPFVDCFVTPRLTLVGKAAFGDRNWKATARLATDDALSDYDEFRSTAKWSVRAELGLNIASSQKVPVTTGGFFGIGGKDTGKDKMQDWHLDLKVGYRRAASSEHSSYARLEYRENW